MLSCIWVFFVVSFAENCMFTVAFHNSKKSVSILENIAMKITDPRSNMYGKYMNPEQINHIILDRKMWQQRNLTLLWIREMGGELVIDFTDGFIFRSNCADNYKELKKYISFIYRHDFKLPRKRIISASVDTTIDSGYVGREVVQRIYRIPDYDSTNSSGCAIEFIEGETGFVQTDLLCYQTNNSYVAKKIPPNHIIGTQIGSDDESELDIQMLANANNSQLWYWVFDKWIYEMAAVLANTAVVPEVISISYGWSERDQCTIIRCLNGTTSESYVTRTNFELMKLALRGITVLVSSGDAGAPGRTAESCGSVNPDFPTSSPWVTSVGATAILSATGSIDNSMPIDRSKLCRENKCAMGSVDNSMPIDRSKLCRENKCAMGSIDNSMPIDQSKLCRENKCAVGIDQVTVMYSNVGWTAGGGFGAFSQTPWYQKESVAEYLKTTALPNVTFNMNGRGYPDLTVVGHNCAMYVAGVLSTGDGTSCSAPIMASIVMRLNQFRRSKGHPVLGFINPLIYLPEYRKAFVDMTVGNNSGTEYGCCNDSGFIASKGWDPVTGIGYPDVLSLMRLLDIAF